MKKILVTGALGYIGTELLYRLSKRTDIEIHALDNDLLSIQTRLGFLLRHDNIKFYNVDITNINDLKKIPEVDIIIHLAAVVGYITCNETPESAKLTNILGTYNISLLQKPTVFLSTGSVYGEIGSTCDETVMTNPQTLYAETKLEGERIIKQTRHTILRPGTAFGLSFKVRHDLLIHTLIQDALSNNYIKLYQPESMRSFYTVQKLAELCEYICDNFEKFENEIVNVGCESGNIKKKEIVDIISKYHEFELKIVPGKDLDTRDYNVKYDKLKNLWPDYDEKFQDKIEKIIGYYRNWKKS